MMKRYKVLFTPDAIADLMGIYDHIVEESNLPEMGWQYIKKLEEKCRRLDIVPVRGQARDDLRENLRILPIEKKVVAAFEVDEALGTVTVLNIFYGGQDYEMLMSTEPR